MADEIARRSADVLDAVGKDRLSLCDLLCDEHPPERVAFTFVDARLRTTDVTYGDLAHRSRRLAAEFARLGVRPGDRVATLMGKSLDLVVTTLAIWRLGAVYVPLFTAFATSAIEMRLTASDPVLVVADSDQLPKLETLPGRWTVIGPAGTALDLAEPPRSVGAPVESFAGTGDTEFIRLYTSGTTGPAKGVMVPVRAVASLVSYLEFTLDCTAEDVYWNSADPGWAYGLYYALVAPMALGRRSIVVTTGFSPALTFGVLAKLGVTNFATAPTVYRALRNHDEPIPPELTLRHCSSAGEPLSPDVIEWSVRALGVPVHDHYGQTELGMCVGNAHHPALSRPLRPGSMGHPLPGYQVTVLRRDADEVAPPGVEGRVAVSTTSPLYWFQGYAGDERRTAERFTADGGWWLTGDVASRDGEGYFFFSAREDDVIIMAGYRIGPFEVESALCAHPAVAEAAVVGVPDELRGEVIAAFVVLADSVSSGDELTRELREHVKSTYSAHAAPRVIRYVAALPKTPSGKIQRFLLRTDVAAAGGPA